MLSLIIPLFNEEGNLEKLTDEILSALKNTDFEIIYVNDGSIDKTWEKIKELQSKLSQIRGINLYGNSGQTSAMKAGIDISKGELVAFMDGDIQNDPADISKLVKKLKLENLDLVVGWRKNRKDSKFLRTIPSKIGNAILTKMANIDIHDTGCSLKVFRRELIDELVMYGFAHRFMPHMSKRLGAKIGEVEVNHRERFSGITKYNWFKKPFETVMDIFYLWFALPKKTTPIRFFGKWAVFSWIISFSFLSLTILTKIIWSVDMTGNPLFIGSLFAFLSGFQFMAMGITNEYLLESEYRKGRKPYKIRETV